MDLQLAGLSDAVHHADVVALTKVPFFVSCSTAFQYQHDIIVNKMFFFFQSYSDFFFCCYGSYHV